MITSLSIAEIEKNLTLKELFERHQVIAYNFLQDQHSRQALNSPSETIELLSAFFDMAPSEISVKDKVPSGNTCLVLSVTSNFLQFCQEGFDFLSVFHPADRSKISAGKAHLVLLSVYETFPEALFLNNSSCLGDYLCKVSRRHELKPSHFHVVFPDPEFRKNYLKWQKGRGGEAMFSPHAINTFEKDAYIRTPDHEVESLTCYPSREFKKAFLCLCARPHRQRLSVFHYLSENDLLSAGYFSFLCRDHSSRIGADAKDLVRGSHWLEGRERFGSFQHFLDTAPHGLNEEESAHDIWDKVDGQSPVAAIQQSVFQLVLETDTDGENCLFVTEKTFKPLLFQQPFLVFGHPGTLRFLRSCGYETFPELFDESYDLEMDNYKRFDLIMENVNRLCGLGLEELTRRAKVPSIAQKLEHNASLFQERSSRPVYVD